METVHDQPQSYDARALAELRNALERATGADEQIDTLISEVFRVESADFTSSAEAGRRLAGQLLPRWKLHVGYNVTGVLPAATFSRGDKGHNVVAPTVPIAILRALTSAIGGR